jgi:hypothetical protein
MIDKISLYFFLTGPILLGEFTGTSEDLPGTLEDFTATSEEFTGTSEDLSGTLEDYTATLEEFTGTSEDLSGTLEDFTATLEDLSGTIEIEKKRIKCCCRKMGVKWGAGILYQFSSCGPSRSSRLKHFLKMGVQVFCAPGEAGAFQWVQIPRGQSLAGSRELQIIYLALNTFLRVPSCNFVAKTGISFFSLCNFAAKKQKDSVTSVLSVAKFTWHFIH